MRLAPPEACVANIALQSISDMHEVRENFERESIREARLALGETENFLRDWCMSDMFCKNTYQPSEYDK